MSSIVVDQINPKDILRVIGAFNMAFAESFKGQGNRDDGNFQDLKTSWRTEEIVEIKEIYLEMLRRNVARASRQGFNFLEFWGWPEVHARDDGTRQVTSRIRVMKITHVPPTPRVTN